MSVIVPHWNTPAALDRCVAALGSGCAEIAHELIVVDNRSAPENAPRIASGENRTVLFNPTNRGFAAACNQAAAIAFGRYLLFLNSDVTVDAFAIARLVEAIESDGNLAGVAPLQRDERGRVSSPARAWLGPVAHAIALLGYARARRPVPASQHSVQLVPWVTAAALLVRARAFRLVGGFDERFFFYEEDEDLGWRFARRGFRVAVCPGTSVEHHGGLSTQAAGAWPALALYDGQARFVRRRSGVVGEWMYRGSTTVAVAAKEARDRLVGHGSSPLARTAPSRVLRLLCSRRTKARIAEE